jgi:hypothetical protein
VALNVEPEFIHCLVVESYALLALEEAIVHRVRRSVLAVVTFARAQTVFVLLEGGTVIVLLYLDNRLQG